jgi:ribosomal protein L11 methyltransferase
MLNLDTLEVIIELNPKDPWSEILIAELSESGFDSFVQTDNGIIAYANASLNADEVLQNSSLKLDEVQSNVSKNIIPHQNWNAQWEENFHPVFVEEYASILAPFHNVSEAKGMSVIIQPQMSFGTGHHQTTWMMTKFLFEMPQIAKNVLDMGTGTGVLAIFAEKLGAERVLAIDIEDWSAENAILNAELNNTNKIEVLCGDVDLLGDETFGLIIANINKNVLKMHMETYANCLDKSGTLLLSGFFMSDIQELKEFAAQFGLSLVEEINKDEWAAMKLTK